MKGWFARIQVWEFNYEHKFKNKFWLRTPVGRPTRLPICACMIREELTKHEQNMPYKSGWGKTIRTLVPWRQGFRHPIKSKSTKN